MPSGFSSRKSHLAHSRQGHVYSGFALMLHGLMSLVRTHFTPSQSAYLRLHFPHDNVVDYLFIEEVSYLRWIRSEDKTPINLAAGSHGREQRRLRGPSSDENSRGEEMRAHEMIEVLVRSSIVYCPDRVSIGRLDVLNAENERKLTQSIEAFCRESDPQANVTGAERHGIAESSGNT
jgi:hypothetical protein